MSGSKYKEIKAGAASSISYEYTWGLTNVSFTRIKLKVSEIFTFQS